MALGAVSFRKSASVNKCLAQLKQMVPSLRGHKRMKKLDLLRHVIDYIQDLECVLANETPGHQGSSSVDEIELSVNYFKLYACIHSLNVY